MSLFSIADLRPCGASYILTKTTYTHFAFRYEQNVGTSICYISRLKYLMTLLPCCLHLAHTVAGAHPRLATTINHFIWKLLLFRKIPSMSTILLLYSCDIIHSMLLLFLGTRSTRCTSMLCTTAWSLHSFQLSFCCSYTFLFSMMSIFIITFRYFS